MKRVTILLLIIMGITAFAAAQAGAGPFRQEGIASWYGGEFDGRPTASGEIFNAGLFTAAHPALPFGTVLTVTNKQNNRKVTVRVNDRGPFVAARIIDLSRAAAEVLDMLATGTAPVVLETAVNTTLGPVFQAGELPPPVPIVPVAAPAPSVFSTPPASGAFPFPITAGESGSPAAPLPARSYGVSPAEIKGGFPDAGSPKRYRLQVGAYKIPRNAVDAFDKLKNAGLNPAYEKNGDIYRVVLAGLAAADIQSIAEILGSAGFQEALIREETGY
jgi:rare lipoprotein A